MKQLTGCRVCQSKWWRALKKWEGSPGSSLSGLSRAAGCSQGSALQYQGLVNEDAFPWYLCRAMSVASRSFFPWCCVPIFPLCLLRWATGKVLRGIQMLCFLLGPHLGELRQACYQFNGHLPMTVNLYIGEPPRGAWLYSLVPRPSKDIWTTDGKVLTHWLCELIFPVVHVSL